MRPENIFLSVFAYAAFCALPNSVYGQSSAAIQNRLSQQNKECTLYAYKEHYRGTIPGADQPVTIAGYTLEGCNGGNNWGRTFGVFYEMGGKVREYKYPSEPMPGPDIDRRSVTVRGDQITVRYSERGPNDAYCCPTLRRIAVYRLTNGAVVPVSPISSDLQTSTVIRPPDYMLDPTLPRVGIGGQFFVNLRLGPSSNTPILGNPLLEGLKVNILDNASRPWYRVQLSDGRVGFIHGNFLSPPESAQ